MQGGPPPESSFGAPPSGGTCSNGAQYEVFPGTEPRQPPSHPRSRSASPISSAASGPPPLSWLTAPPASVGPVPPASVAASAPASLEGLLAALEVQAPATHSSPAKRR